MTTQIKQYRLQSAQMLYAPGIIAWARNGYAFESDREQVLGVVMATWKGVPEDAAKALLSGEVSFSIDAEEAVVFQHASDTELATEVAT